MSQPTRTLSQLTQVAQDTRIVRLMGFKLATSAFARSSSHHSTHKTFISIWVYVSAYVCIGFFKKNMCTFLIKRIIVLI